MKGYSLGSVQGGGIGDRQVAPIGEKDWEGVRSVAVDGDVGAGEGSVWGGTVVWGESFKKLDVSCGEGR